ncbi:MAG: Holliday junction resolvase RuvX [Terriglobales bacterium]
MWAAREVLDGKGEIDRRDKMGQFNMGTVLARILALDLGQRRIGMAVSDPLRLSAQGLETLQRRSLGQDLAALAALAAHYQSGLWLLGLPRHMSGEEGVQAKAARQFGAALGRRTGLAVEFWDERLTSVEANRVLRTADASLDQRRKAVDRMAAVILLQSYLDRAAAVGINPPGIVDS